MTDDTRERRRVWRKKFDRYCAAEEHAQRERAREISTQVRKAAHDNPLCRSFM